MLSAQSASPSYAAAEHGTEQILKKMHNVPGHQRMTQAFLCTMPGESNEQDINVINIHASSAIPIMTDAQRIQLIRNLLQSSSMTKANRPIDEGKFLIGGDMNTLSTFR